MRTTGLLQHCQTHLQTPSWRSEWLLRDASLIELHKTTLQAASELSEQGLRLEVTASVKRAGFRTGFEERFQHTSSDDDVIHILETRRPMGIRCNSKLKAAAYPECPVNMSPVVMWARDALTEHLAHEC